MTIAAVICEYNPFHNGHKYQLDMIRKKLNADYIICIMSGDYVQRGEPAIFSKEIRTRWALENGADLVLQLPIAYSTGSADLFATGAVSILNRLGCVDYLCFGSECGDIDTLCICAEKLLTEGQVGSEGIRALMKQGNTFAKSRYLLFPEFEMLLQYSNNVLALEYIMALMRSKSLIKPYTIKREGADYDDATINSDEKYLSATAIRKAFMDKETEKIKPFVPYNPDTIGQKPVFMNDYSGEMFYCLLTKQDTIHEHLETSEDLTKRMISELYSFTDLTSYIEHIKAKNYTYTRISRTLLHILLGIKGSNTMYKEMIKHVTHVKVLGFKASSKDLLTIISDKSTITLMTKVPGIYETLNSVTKSVVDDEVFASSLYGGECGKVTHEFSKQIILVK